MMKKNSISILLLILLVFNWVTIPAKILTLSEAEHKAVTTGFDARSKYFEEQAKEWEKKNTIANYLPTVDYSLNFLRLGDKSIKESNKVFEGFGLTFVDIEILKDQHPGVSFLSDSIATESTSEYASPFTQFKNSLKHEFTINQPITNGGVEVIAIKIAKQTKKAIELEQKALQQEIIYTARKAYFDVLAATERTKVAKQDLSWTKSNLHKSRIKHETGNAPITDLLQWESDVAKKESAVLDAEATEKFLMHSLYQVMGFTSYNIDEYKLQPFDSFEKWYLKGVVQTNDSINNNIQLQSIKHYTRASEGYKKVAFSSFLPKVNAFLSATFEQAYNDNEKFFDIDIEKKPPNLAYGAVMTMPLFSGFKNSTNYKKANYEYKKSVIEEQKVESLLKVNLERIKLFYNASYEGVKAAKKQQELMEKQMEIMQKRYDGGLVNQSQLLEVALGASQTRIGYIQKLFECLLYEAEYLKNVGKLEVTR